MKHYYNDTPRYPDLDETCRMADAQKLSYGQYVAKYGVVFNRKNRSLYSSKFYRKTCDWCGSVFVSKINRARFCCTECRVKYNRNHK